jgi:hypothetical protein
VTHHLSFIYSYPGKAVYKKKHYTVGLVESRIDPNSEEEWSFKKTYVS